MTHHPRKQRFHAYWSMVTTTLQRARTPWAPVGARRFAPLLSLLFCLPALAACDPATIIVPCARLTDYYPDRDHDGYGSDGASPVSACADPSTASLAYATTRGDCDDANPDVNPGANEYPGDGIDQDCDSFETCFPDADGDGYRPDTPATVVSLDADCGDSMEAGVETPAGDCDDGNADVHPGRIETCNGVDDDCNGAVDDTQDQAWYQDADGDGFGVTTAFVLSCSPVPGHSATPGDCNDADPDAYPFAPETCNGRDDDCDGLADEGFPAYWFQDQDGDGFGDEKGMATCAAADGFVASRGDCDDARNDVYPGAEDPPGDVIDQDCGGGDGPQPSVGPVTSLSTSRATFDTIQAALDAAGDNDTIWVFPGHYAEADIRVPPRDVSLVSTHFAEATVVGPGEEGGAGSAPVFRLEDLSEYDIVLDGLTIAGARNAQGPGGGLFVVRSSPRILGCVIRDNTALSGAGIYVEAGAPRLENCRISNNIALSGAHYAEGAMCSAIGGGGLHATQEARPELIGSLVEDNLATYGGGLLLTSGSDALVHDTRVLYNSAFNPADLEQESTNWDPLGGDGGGAFLCESNATFNNTVFAGNYARVFGGGAILGDNTGGERTGSSATFVNCVISGNSAGMEGGGLEVWMSVPFLRYCTIVGNTTADGAGLCLHDAYTRPIIENSIVAFNAGYNLCLHDDGYGDPDPGGIQYNDFYNDEAVSSFSGNTFDGSTGTSAVLPDSNLAVDPLFLYFDPQGSDLHLARESPLPDSGTPGDIDPDGSPASMGCFGGPAGDAWDLDGDGFPDYFWPGTLDEAPQAVDPAHYDRDDLDPTVH